MLKNVMIRKTKIKGLEELMNCRLRERICRRENCKYL